VKQWSLDDAKTKSCVLKTSCANLANEMAKVQIDPNLSSMMSPHVFENLYRNRYGDLPKRGRFPIIGQVGNGLGSLFDFV